jgi:transposase-like protein
MIGTHVVNPDGEGLRVGGRTYNALMPRYSESFIKFAVVRAREIGTRAAARELAIDTKTLRAWRRSANRAQARDDLQAELDTLEQRIATVDDLGELQRIQRELAKIVRELNIDPERLPFLYVTDDAA